MSATTRHYRLKCQLCETTFDDDSFALTCPAEHEPALLISDYADRRFEIDSTAEGIYRYQRWLPIVRTLKGAGRTVTYKSERLNRVTGLPNLWIAFNGYWPERGASLETGTFKELEAYAVLARLPEKRNGVLVVASAGNTAAAFARSCSVNKAPCLIIVPESGLDRVRHTAPLDDCVKIVSLTGFADYYDAITLAERVSAVGGFFPEGGVKNVARRDGLGTVMLNAVETIGVMPDYYFQAVGSGSGAIAAHEATKRLCKTGQYGNSLPRLMLSQNLPFVPLYLSWKSGRRELISIDADDGKKQIKEIIAHVLSNRKPPYSIKGGVFDILNEGRGDMLVADNKEAICAGQLFQEVEGIDIDPAGAVALATLLKAARRGQIAHEAIVLLNITGGGWFRRSIEKRQAPAQADLQIDASQVDTDSALEKVVGLFA